ncbi:unnamed protein product [Rhizoctonia solani]|uniref:Uncharacterized protein n=1 Tax=Rhizoctonia solani TaxID=456999 RepID=A0A8H2XZA6_9AGAM|nr:unnamed protein product [Rhizoctonia solani]
MNNPRNKELLHSFVDALLADPPQSTVSSRGINDQLLNLASRLDETNRLIADSIKSSDRQFGEVKSQLDGINRRLGHVERRVGHIERRLGHIERRLGHIKRRLGHVERQVVNGNENSDLQFEDIRTRFGYYDRPSESRSLNSCAHVDEGVLHPLPVPTGQLPIEGVFPQTAFDFRRLETVEVENLLRLYELPVDDSAVVNHAELARHIGVRW